MTNYSRGAAFENRVAHDFERHGYVSIRAAGSHSPADVYAMRPGELILVQCKIDGRLDPLEWNGFLDYSERAGGLPIMAERQGRKIVYHLITGRKDGTRKSQPMEDWSIE